MMSQYKKENKFFCKGDITQLVECMLCKHKVIGSSPIISSFQFNLKRFSQNKFKWKNLTGIFGKIFKMIQKSA